MYRRLIRLRSLEPALRIGELRWLDAPAGVMAFRRSFGNREIDVWLNFVARAKTVTTLGGSVLDDPGETIAAGDREIGPYEVLITAREA